MKSLRMGLIAAASVTLLAGPAFAVSIPVSNFSFEDPAGVLSNGGCGVGCSYDSGPISGWTIVGGGGRFQPGSSSGNFAYFNYVPDGVTVAYSNGGTIYQTLGNAVAGWTYTLQVDVGVRNDLPNPGIIDLMFASSTATATGLYPSAGNWSTFTAIYTATTFDAGNPITIALNSPGGQGDWDNVRLSAIATPLPATWTMMLAGLSVVGFFANRRKKHNTALVAA